MNDISQICGIITIFKLFDCYDVPDFALSS